MQAHYIKVIVFIACVIPLQLVRGAHSSLADLLAAYPNISNGMTFEFPGQKPVVQRGNAITESLIHFKGAFPQPWVTSKHEGKTALEMVTQQINRARGNDDQHTIGFLSRMLEKLLASGATPTLKMFRQCDYLPQCCLHLVQKSTVELVRPTTMSVDGVKESPFGIIIDGICESKDRNNPQYEQALTHILQTKGYTVSGETIQFIVHKGQENEDLLCRLLKNVIKHGTFAQGDSTLEQLLGLVVTFHRGDSEAKQALIPEIQKKCRDAYGAKKVAEKESYKVKEAGDVIKQVDDIPTIDEDFGGKRPLLDSPTVNSSASTHSSSLQSDVDLSIRPSRPVEQPDQLPMPQPKKKRSGVILTSSSTQGPWSRGGSKEEEVEPRKRTALIGALAVAGLISIAYGIKYIINKGKASNNREEDKRAREVGYVPTTYNGG